jgi:hypothetical protein
MVDGMVILIARLDNMAKKLQPLHHYVAKLQFEHKRYTDIYNLLVPTIPTCILLHALIRFFMG